MLLNIGDKLADRYIIEEKIGQGGMSYVYKASDSKLGRVVAVKVLKSEFSYDEEFIKKFKNEAKSAAKLSHPNIVTAYDTADEGNLHYIIMELVEGITLKNYIARKGKLSNKETLGIAIQAAEGIEEAHRKGIIHRDIKPQNIIISRDGKVKVADFGIAKAVSGETINPAVIGSVHYISPEQAKSGTADMRSDLYSLGITMYEMITGRVPFAGDNTVNVVMAQISEAIVPPQVYAKDIYPALNDIILKATKKNPEERYQTAGDLILDLKRCGREPDGHFVRMYASSENKKTVKENENDEENKHPSSENIEIRSKIDTASKAIVNNEEADKEIERNFVSSHNDRNSTSSKETETEQEQIKKLIKSGLILAVAVLFVVVVFSIINISGLFRSFSKEETDKSTMAEESSSTVQTDESNYNITIYAEDIMPNLIGLTVDAAKAKTADLDIVINDALTDYSDVYYEGLIIDQSIKPDEGVLPGAEVIVTVSLGTKINYALKAIKGKTLDEAVQLLSNAGVIVSSETERAFSEEVPRDRVIGWKSEDESIGSSNIIEGSVVKLILSSGSHNDLMIMPNLLGMDQEAAKTMLSDSGLQVGEITEMPSPNTPKGYVIGQSVPANAELAYGTKIDFVISSELNPDAQLTLPFNNQETSSASEDYAGYYYGNIDTVCTVGHAQGPDSASKQVMVAIRLKQRTADGAFEYTVLEDPKPVAFGSKIPVSFRNIKGIEFVEKGDIQVYNAETNEVYNTYTIDFKPKGGL